MVDSSALDVVAAEDDMLYNVNDECLLKLVLWAASVEILAHT